MICPIKWIRRATKSKVEPDASESQSTTKNHHWILRCVAHWVEREHIVRVNESSSGVNWVKHYYVSWNLNYKYHLSITNLLQPEFISNWNCLLLQPTIWRKTLANGNEALSSTFPPSFSNAIPRCWLWMLIRSVWLFETQNNTVVWHFPRVSRFPNAKCAALLILVSPSNTSPYLRPYLVTLIGPSATILHLLLLVASTTMFGIEWWNFAADVLRMDCSKWKSGTRHTYSAAVSCPISTHFVTINHSVAKHHIRCAGLTAVKSVIDKTSVRPHRIFLLELPCHRRTIEITFCQWVKLVHRIAWHQNQM